MNNHKVSLMEVKAIIFDLDGVITDTANLHFKAWSKMAKEFSYTLTQQDNENIKGLDRRDTLEKILEFADVQLSEKKMEELMKEKNEFYQELLKELTEEDTLPGFHEFFLDCKTHDFKLAVGSSSKNAKLILEKLGRLHDFDVIIDGSMVENSKPDPEVFLNAAKEMGVDSEYCIVFEDAKAGVEAANKGGFFSVGVGDAEQLSNAKKVIPNLSDYKVNDLMNHLNAR